MNPTYQHHACGIRPQQASAISTGRTFFKGSQGKFKDPNDTCNSRLPKLPKSTHCMKTAPLKIPHPPLKLPPVKCFQQVKLKLKPRFIAMGTLNNTLRAMPRENVYSQLSVGGQIPCSTKTIQKLQQQQQPPAQRCVREWWKTWRPAPAACRSRWRRYHTGMVWYGMV